VAQAGEADLRPTTERDTAGARPLTMRAFTSSGIEMRPAAWQARKSATAMRNCASRKNSGVVVEFSTHLFLCAHPRQLAHPLLIV
jgi:hypothetical protein